MTKKLAILTAICLACASAFGGEPNTKTQSMNESARGLVGTGDNVVIVGVIIGGRDYAQVVFRGIGPALSNYGLSNVLHNPELSVYDGAGKLIAHQRSHLENSPSDAKIIADLGLTPTNVNECALVFTLTPGNYTAILRGENGTTGIGLAEIYKIEPAVK